MLAILQKKLPVRNNGMTQNSISPQTRFGGGEVTTNMFYYFL